ncbi:phosphotransferase family protein [Longispora albida]|uniref:phosphotransferase family protein n=1 Tax=Longispora albida TaxID=203523 RepID=UPI00037556CD|nr:phosphotransferase [Longispora albida]
MRRLAHGYTNDTSGDGRIVVKRYAGPDAQDRAATERLWLGRMRGLLPVPPVLDGDDSSSTLGFVEGVHGQELLDQRPAEILDACGRMLARLQAAEPGLVHGDFGPNNLLFAPATLEVSAILDWEWAHIGDGIEDLAWCEWVVRMHHLGSVTALGALFTGYGSRPAWELRQAAMLTRCRALEDFCERWVPGGDGVQQWRDRAATVATWTEASQ